MFRTKVYQRYCNSKFAKLDGQFINEDDKSKSETKLLSSHLLATRRKQNVYISLVVADLPR